MEVLPSELVRECLLRVPYTSHDNLRAVCRQWEDILSSPNFYGDRKLFGTSEQVICLIGKFAFDITIYSPLNGTWKMLPPINDPQSPGMPLDYQCVSVNRKLVVMGGFHRLRPSKVMNTVFIYDFESSRWSRGADMPTPRFEFACSFSSSTGLIYVAGGFETKNRDPLRSAEAYDVDKDRWEILPPMIEGRGGGSLGLFIDGKFLVLSAGRLNSGPWYTYDAGSDVFDPCTGSWTIKKERLEFVLARCRPVAYGNSLYVFGERKVTKYDAKNGWSSNVASIPDDITHVMCATRWHDWILVTGAQQRVKRSSVESRQIYYLFNPLTGQWIEVKGDGEDGIRHILYAVPLEI